MFMKSLIRLLVLALTVLPATLWAQQNPQYSLFMFNKQTINPAYVGSRGAFSINADYRTQWVKVDGGPETFNIGVHTPLGRGATIPRLAAGVLFTQEEIGIQTKQGLAAQLAYRIPLSKSTILSFGVEGALYGVSYDDSNLRAEDQDDVVVNGLNGSPATSHNFSAGAYLYSTNYFLGLSSMQLLEEDRQEDQPKELESRRHFFLMGGYVLGVTTNFKLRASAIGKFVHLEDGPDSPLNGDFNLSGIFYDRFLLGATYRTDASVALTTQFQITQSLNIAYAYDFKTSSFAQSAGVSHEIFLGIDLAGKTGPMTSPRFVSYF